MTMSRRTPQRVLFAVVLLATALIISGSWRGPTAHADTTPAFSFSNGTPDGLMGMATRPGPTTGPDQETEAADDVVLASPTTISQATFTGLVPPGTSLLAISRVVVEVYRVFPKDSANPPSGHVPTRANSPSDVEFVGRDSANGSLSFSSTVVNESFSALNSVDTGIHPSPNQTTGGEGTRTGREILITTTFNPPLSLPADHYFIVPQVLVNPATSHFLWLSSLRPNPAVTPDLQAWIRNAQLDPDWLRVGTDIVGGQTPPTFNAAFTLSGPPTITGANGSALIVKSGQSVVLSNAQQSGSVTVQPGGSLTVLNSTITGGISATGAAGLEVCGSDIGGTISSSGATGPITIGDGAGCAGNTIHGGVNLINNHGAVVVAGNTITGTLSCSGNNGTTPTNNGATNTAPTKTGQCSAL